MFELDAFRFHPNTAEVKGLSALVLNVVSLYYSSETSSATANTDLSQNLPFLIQVNMCFSPPQGFNWLWPRAVHYWEAGVWTWLRIQMGKQCRWTPHPFPPFPTKPALPCCSSTWPQPLALITSNCRPFPSDLCGAHSLATETLFGVCCWDGHQLCTRRLSCSVRFSSRSVLLPLKRLRSNESQPVPRDQGWWPLWIKSL